MLVLPSGCKTRTVSADIGLLFSLRMVVCVVFLGLLRVGRQYCFTRSRIALTLPFIDLLAGLLGATESTLHADHLEFSVIPMWVIMTQQRTA
jgi:hypothetical protein